MEEGEEENKHRRKEKERNRGKKEEATSADLEGRTRSSLATRLICRFTSGGELEITFWIIAFDTSGVGCISCSKHTTKEKRQRF